MNRESIYFVTIEDHEDKVLGLSLVDTPAMGGEISLSHIDDDILVKYPIIKANTPIQRNNIEMGGKYWVIFTEQSIITICTKLLSDSGDVKITSHHTNTPLNGVELVECYLYDDQTMSGEFNDLPNGSWIVSLRVSNPTLKRELLSHNYGGISIEGVFTYTQLTDSQIFELHRLLNSR